MFQLNAGYGRHLERSGTGSQAHCASLELLPSWCETAVSYTAVWRSSELCVWVCLGWEGLRIDVEAGLLEGKSVV